MTDDPSDERVGQIRFVWHGKATGAETTEAHAAADIWYLLDLVAGIPALVAEAQNARETQRLTDQQLDHLRGDMRIVVADRNYYQAERNALLARNQRLEGVAHAARILAASIGVAPRGNFPKMDALRDRLAALSADATTEPSE